MGVGVVASDTEEKKCRLQNTRHCHRCIVCADRGGYIWCYRRGGSKLYERRCVGRRVSAVTFGLTILRLPVAASQRRHPMWQ